jgi:hypothetical protein
VNSDETPPPLAQGLKPGGTPRTGKNGAEPTLWPRITVPGHGHGEVHNRNVRNAELAREREERGATITRPGPLVPDGDQPPRPREVVLRVLSRAATAAVLATLANELLRAVTLLPPDRARVAVGLTALVLLGAAAWQTGVALQAATTEITARVERARRHTTTDPHR